MDITSVSSSYSPPSLGFDYDALLKFMFDNQIKLNFILSTLEIVHHSNTKQNIGSYNSWLISN